MAKPYLTQDIRSLKGRCDMKEKIGMSVMLMLYTIFFMAVFTSPMWAR